MVAWYFVFLASNVDDAPKGSSVALSPSALNDTVTSVTCVVPLDVTLKSLKVDWLRVVCFITSEKLAVREAPRATSVAAWAGVVPVTLGAMLLTATSRVYSVSPPSLSMILPLTALLPPTLVQDAVLVPLGVPYPEPQSKAERRLCLSTA